MAKNFRIIFCGDVFEKETVCGIYAMYVGSGVMYIGRSVDIKRRAWEHKYLLQNMFKEYGNDPGKLPEYHYLYNIFHELIINPKSDVLWFCILEECDRSVLIEREQFWLEEGEWQPNCANIGFEARPSSGDTKILNLKNAKPPN